MKTAPYLVLVLAAGGSLLAAGVPPRAIQWLHLTSSADQLPVPGESTQQTGALVADLDNDKVQDFVLSFRQKPPALVWYRRAAGTWRRVVIEPAYLPLEAGGAAHDIDRDGDLDIVFGEDSQGSGLWWWENPYPNFVPTTGWTRRAIKKDGARQHHDQVFADFKGTGRAQLVYWNQGAKTLFLAEIPADPKAVQPWPAVPIFSGSAGEGSARYAEGVAAHDVDGDGLVDLLAGNYWFKYRGGNRFDAVSVSDIGGRIAAAKFKPGRFAQIVIAPGDGTGPLRWFECRGEPTDASSWVGQDLLGREMAHGHTLQLGDIDADGNVDIFAAEMAKWTHQRPESDNPEARAWILFGDGRGNFEKTEFSVGVGFHEGRLADLDGDGDLDILGKPYAWQTPRVDVWLNNGTGPRARQTGK